MTRLPTAALNLLLPLTLTAAPLGVVKLDSPPKPEWVVVPCDPVLTTLSVPTASVWVLVDDQPACDLRPASDGKTATFAAAGDGQYRVLVIAEKEVHRVKLVRATNPPQPMPPTPGPGPQPDPKPPAPADPLVRVLQAGYDADTRTAELKRTDLLDLIELYRQAGTLAADPAVPTAGDLVKRVRDAATVLKIVGLPDCRKAIAGELVAVFPEDTPLTADTRKKAGDTFARIKVCLEGVK